MKLSAFLRYPAESWKEVRKMVWPSRATNFESIGYIIVFMTLVSALIWASDSFLEWAIFDALLQWKKL